MRNVLSLFDGMSCGQIALERAGITYDNYYASEIDKYAIKVTQANYPGTIQLGDITKVSGVENVDLLLGGSPCQGFSFAGKMLNFDDPRSKLFFEYVRLLKEVKPKWFLLENVKMKKESEKVISEHLGVEPIEINSNLVSAQNRRRLYWTNIPNVKQSDDRKITVADILEDDPPDYTRMSDKWLEWWAKNKDFQLKKKYSAYANLDGKALCCTARQYASWNGNFIYQLGRGFNKGGDKGFIKSPSLSSSYWQGNNLLVTADMIRKFSCVEVERLQTVPDGYTNRVSNSQRYKMLGNSWTVDVIAHILNYLKAQNENTQKRKEDR